MGIKRLACVIKLGEETFSFDDERVLRDIQRKLLSGRQTDEPMFIDGPAQVRDYEGDATGEDAWRDCHVTINLNKVDYIDWHVEEEEEKKDDMPDIDKIFRQLEVERRMQKYHIEEDGRMVINVKGNRVVVEPYMSRENQKWYKVNGVMCQDINQVYEQIKEITGLDMFEIMGL